MKRSLFRCSVRSLSTNVGEKICVLGAGSFGSVMSRVAGQSSHVSEVRVWARRDKVATEINEARTNQQYLRDAKFPEKVTATSDLKEAVRGASVIVFAVPSNYLSDLLPIVAEHKSPDAVAVSLIKSLHYNESKLTTVTQELSEALPGTEVTCLMGPNIYTEMALDLFSEATIGYNAQSADGKSAARRVQKVFDTSVFKTSLSEDRIGVELAGGLKNVVALAAGFCEGLGLGSNTRAAVIRVGLHEMTRLSMALGCGGSRSSFFEDASGVGDLMLTCTSGRGRLLAGAFAKAFAELGPLECLEQSRNRWAALEDELFSGMRLPDWHTAQVVWRALSDHGLQEKFPLFSAVYRIGFLGAPPSEIVTALAKGIEVAEDKPIFAAPGPCFVGKKALVTGAARGLGKEIAITLHRAGAEVIAVDYLEEGLSALQAEIGCDVLTVDLMDVKAVTSHITDLLATKGPIQLLVNNAGVANFQPFFETTMEAWDVQYGVNVKAVTLLTQLVTKGMVDAKLSGSVVHISSQSSTIPLTEHLVYSSSKAAIDHITRIQALELGQFDIRVNSVRPTVALTELALSAWKPENLKVLKEQIPLRRLAQPLDVANAVLWLLSDQAAMVTGSCLAVDGGRSMGGYGL